MDNGYLKAMNNQDTHTHTQAKREKYMTRRKNKRRGRKTESNPKAHGNNKIDHADETTEKKDTAEAQ